MDKNFFLGGTIIIAMIPNFSKIKAQAKKNYSEIEKENINEIREIIKGSIDN